MSKLVDYLVENDVNFRKSRLPALYADFSPLKNLNPDGYEANVFAWGGAIARLASEGLLSRQGSRPYRFILESSESLRTSLAHREYGTPQSLGVAIRECVSRSALVQLQKFIRTPRPIYQKPSWGSFPWNIVTWSAQHLEFPNLFRGDTIVSDEYVIMRNLEAASTKVGKKIDEDMSSLSKYDRAMHTKFFLQDYASPSMGNQPIAVEDAQVLLCFLSRDKEMIAWDGTTVRIRAKGEDGLITPEDTTIGWNKVLMVHLDHQISVLSKKILDSDKEAREAVSSKNRIKALACLKSKKLAETALAQKYATLHSLEDMASKIQQASDQVEFVKLMEHTTGTIKTLNEQLGGVRSVDAIVTRLREQMSATDEAAAILAESPGVVIDELELDDELESLEKAERDKAEKEQEKQEVAEALTSLSNLPAVPMDPVLERTKTQSPTTETGIERLALRD